MQIEAKLEALGLGLADGLAPPGVIRWANPIVFRPLHGTWNDRTGREQPPAVESVCGVVSPLTARWASEKVHKEANSFPDPRTPLYGTVT